jgi:hypothetical protein
VPELRWSSDDPSAPWNKQVGWQVAVGVRRPRLYALKRVLAHLIRR